MPIYEYQCAQCGHSLESFQTMAEPPLTQCPVCTQPTLQKLISAAGFQLKGTGWYATDFRNKGKPPVEKATSKEEGGNSQGTSETKPAETKPNTDAKIKETAVN